MRKAVKKFIVAGFLAAVVPAAVSAGGNVSGLSAAAGAMSAAVSGGDMTAADEMLGRLFGGAGARAAAEPVYLNVRSAAPALPAAKPAAVTAAAEPPVKKHDLTAIIVSGSAARAAKAAGAKAEKSDDGEKDDAPKKPAHSETYQYYSDLGSGARQAADQALGAEVVSGLLGTGIVVLLICLL